MVFSIGGSASRTQSRSETNASRELDVTEIVNKLSEKGREGLDDLIDYLGKTIQDGQSIAMTQAQERNKLLTREQALADSAGAVQEIMKSSSKELFPQLFKAQQGSGAYNSTSAQLLADSKQAEAAAKGAALQSATISNYEQLSQKNIETALADDSGKSADLLKALGLDADATSKLTKNEKETGSSKTTGASSSVGISGSFGF